MSQVWGMVEVGCIMELPIWLPLEAVGLLLLLALLYPWNRPSPNHEFIVGLLIKMSEELNGDDGKEVGKLLPG